LLCAVSPIRFNVLTLQRFNGGKAGYTLTPLLLDPFYGVQGKFVRNFRWNHKLTRIGTKMEQAEEMMREVRAPEMFRILGALTAREPDPLFASCNSC